MKSKKLIVLLIAGAMIASGLAACSSASNETNKPTQVVTEVVTNEKGEAVTDANGEVVTEVVTDQNGNPVTEVVSSTDATSTTSATTTTKKPDVSMSDGTTKPQATTTPSTTQKQLGEFDIVLEKNSKALFNPANVSLSNGQLVISKPGDYVITQNTGSEKWHGQIIVKLNSAEKAELKFENVNISNTTKNIIQILDNSITSNRDFLEAESAVGSPLEDVLQSVIDDDGNAPDVSLSFPEGTKSSFETSANSITGVLYNESKLTIKGNGSATFASTKNANNCICSTKSITIKNINALNLTTAQNTNTSSLGSSTGSAKGIYSYSKVTLESGKLVIKSNGDAIRCAKFHMKNGTADIQSSACDAIDTDDSITIDGGKITALAYEKYSFKVRRVNNSENLKTGSRVRAGKGDGFRINGGTVIGESKKISSLVKNYQSNFTGSGQASVTAKIVKQNAGTADAQGESKVPAIISIGSWKSVGKCTKYLYSSPKVVQGTSYAVKAGANAAEGITWKTTVSGKLVDDNAGVAIVKNSTNQ